MILRALMLLMLAGVLQGCVIAVNTDDWENESWLSRQHRNAEAVEKLSIGMSEASIRKQIGDPDYTDSFVRAGETYRVLYYRTHHRDHDGVTTKDETTPLVFIDSELVGWGETAITHAAR